MHLDLTARGIDHNGRVRVRRHRCIHLDECLHPPSGELASIEFIGTGGADVTYELIGDSDIRDFSQGRLTIT